MICIKIIKYQGTLLTILKYHKDILDIINQFEIYLNNKYEFEKTIKLLDSKDYA